MSQPALHHRALAAAIVVLLTVGCMVALAGRSEADELGLERAEIGTGVMELASARPTEVVAEASGAPNPTPVDGPAAVEAAEAPAPEATPAFAPPDTVAAPTTTTSIPPAPTTAAPVPSPTPTTAPPVPASTTTAPPSDGTVRDGACETAMLGWMNESRADAGLHALVDDPAVQQVSLDWSRNLARSGDLAHNPRYSDQVFAVRPEAVTAGEIVGWASGTARAVYDEFLRSPTHRDKILMRSFDHSTVGCVRDVDGRVWVTVDFWG